MKSDKNKIYLFITVVVIVGILTTLSSFALWTVASNNINVAVNTFPPLEGNVRYTEGHSILAGDLPLCLNYFDGINTTFTIGKESTLSEHLVYASMHLKTNDDNYLAYAGAIKWQIRTASSASPLASGTLADFAVGSNIMLDNIEVTTTDTSYTFYIWVDSTYGDANALAGLTIDLELWMEVRYERYNVRPVVNEGLIPVVFDTTSGTVVKTIGKNDSDWYNYNKQKWANAVLVTDSSRSTYQNTSGVVVSEEDILAYYVWIPRYKYRIPEIKCSTLTNPTLEEYPECYELPYSMSGSDKTLLINWCHAYAQSAGFTSYTLEEATTDVNNALQTGTFSNATLGLEVPISELIDIYNQNNTDNHITYTMEFSSSNNITTVPREIDIIYEDKSTNKSLGDAVNTYYTHPAFTFGDMEVNGIWVGKFETGGTATDPLIKPDISSLRGQKVSEEFTTAQIFGTSTYGMTSNVDAHMMKNSEWGAVAYLSHSRYGVNREVYINNSSGHYTGRSGGNVGGSTAINTVYTNQTATAQYNKYGFYTWDGYLLEYNTNTQSSTRDLNKVASTTGNITGVYDMSGGAYEYVMGNYNNTIKSSGFTTLPDSKYYDNYTTTNSLTACNGGICYGHGLSEVSNWYRDYFNLVNGSAPWFLRGGVYYNDSGAGTFYFSEDNGNAYGNRAARSVLVVGS